MRCFKTRLRQDGFVDLSRQDLVQLTLTWIRQRTPAAVVRFGEGEGRLLAASPTDAESMQVASNKLRRQTGLRFPPKEVLRVRSLVTNAFDQADVVGIRGSASFSSEHKMWVRRIESELDKRLARGRSAAYVAHCVLNQDLRGALDSLLEGQRRMSVVSCRDVQSHLEDQYGIDVRKYQVPSQYTTRAVDGEYEGVLHDVPIWPEFYEQLRGEISVREPGEVFLVGAGIFGKDLCIRVRELGGVALDMGSCLDDMAGKVTRGGNRPPPYHPVSSRKLPIAGSSQAPSRRKRLRSYAARAASRIGLRRPSSGD